MTFWAYILRCGDGSYYTGQTEDLEQRVHQHQTGVMQGYTHSRRPVELVWSEAFEERAQAMEAERRVKDWSRKKKEALIAGDESRVLLFSRQPGERNLSRVSEDLADARQGPSLRSGKRVWKLPSPRAERGALSSEARLPAEATLENGNTSDKSTHPRPVIVLVRPQLGENIGKAARAMLNFGLTELRIVSPRDGWPNPTAGPAAAGADSVIADAQIFDTVAEAVADCPHVYATTVRKRGITKPVVTPEAAALAIHSAPERSAIMFGPERSGLETDDVAVARTILTVPINPKFGSLNLAQAVMVVAYEWSKGEPLAQPPLVPTEPPASQHELDGLIGQLDEMLEYAGFYFPVAKVPTMKRAVRTIMTKPGWNEQEVRTLRGVLTAIQKPRAR